MHEVLHNIWAGIIGASWLDPLNFVLGIVGVWLMIKRTLWAFPVNLAGVTVQCILFVQIRFPADATLQVFFFITLVWGWRHWVRDKGAAPELPVTMLSWKERGVIFAIAAAGMAIWARTVGPWMNAVMPWRDAFIAAFGVVGQILQVRKNLENWAVWTLVNVVAVISYWDAAAPFSAFLYAIYLVMGLMGWVEWTRTFKRQSHG